MPGTEDMAVKNQTWVPASLHLENPKQRGSEQVITKGIMSGTLEVQAVMGT